MNSLILRTTTRLVLPLMLVFSLFLLLRGHNEPGGGFVGGLVAASGIALYAIAYDPRSARKLLRVDGRTLIGAGLLVAAGSGLAGPFAGRPVLSGVWTHVRIPGLGPVEVGTPLLFDAGVYLVVVGVTLKILLALAEEE